MMRGFRLQILWNGLRLPAVKFGAWPQSLVLSGQNWIFLYLYLGPIEFRWLRLGKK